MESLNSVVIQREVSCGSACGELLFWNRIFWNRKLEA